MSEHRIWRVRLPALIASNKSEEAAGEFDDVVDLIEQTHARELAEQISRLETALQYAMDGMTVSQKMHVKKLMGGK